MYDTLLMFFTIGKLLVALTMPASPKSFDVAQQVGYLQQYKEAFLAKEVLTVIVGFLAEPLGKERFVVYVRLHLLVLSWISLIVGGQKKTIDL